MVTLVQGRLYYCTAETESLTGCFQGKDTQGASHGHGHTKEQAGGAHG